MYISPMFDFFTRELIDENALRSWAVSHGGEWLPETDCQGEHHQVQWDFGVEVWLDTLNDKDVAEWTPHAIEVVA